MEVKRSNMRAVRMLRGMTMADVAEAIGVHKNTVQTWERGTFRPTEQNLDSLARLYKCDKSFLLEETDEPEISIPAMSGTSHA